MNANCFLGDMKDRTRIDSRVVAGEIARLREFRSEKVCNDIISILSGSVKYGVRFVLTYCYYMLSQKCLKEMKSNNGSFEKF